MILQALGRLHCTTWLIILDKLVLVVLRWLNNMVDIINHKAEQCFGRFKGMTAIKTKPFSLSMRQKKSDTYH